MHPAFVPPGAAPAIPIWFVTGTTWPALRVALEPGARAFVDAAAGEEFRYRNAPLRKMTAEEVAAAVEPDRVYDYDLLGAK